MFFDKLIGLIQPSFPPNLALSELLYILAVLLKPISLMLSLISLNKSLIVTSFFLVKTISERKYSFFESSCKVLTFERISFLSIMT